MNALDQGSGCRAGTENTCDMGFPVMNRPHGVTRYRGDIGEIQGRYHGRTGSRSLTLTLTLTRTRTRTLTPTLTPTRSRSSSRSCPISPLHLPYISPTSPQVTQLLAQLPASITEEYAPHPPTLTHPHLHSLTHPNPIPIPNPNPHPHPNPNPNRHRYVLIAETDHVFLR